LKAILLIFIFSIAVIETALANNDHDIHLSLCELRYNELSSTFEVSIKIFIDDLETAIGKENHSALRIGTQNEAPEADELIASYLSKNFSIDIDGVKLKGSFLGKELTDDMLAVWCYVEFPVKKSQPQKCVLSNNILFEIYDDQRNIMDIRMSRSHKDYTIFERGRNTWSYTY
jgi:hypothetical protein